MTVNTRSNETLTNTIRAVEAQNFDERLIVYDGVPETRLREMKRLCDWPSIAIERPAGWICPAHAWNVGFSHVTTEYVVCISSEVILGKSAMERIRELITGPPVVVFGYCEDDGDVPLVGAGNVLCSSTLNRPLGFIVAIPMWVVRTLRGYDEAFMDGLCYEDDEFFSRVFNLGVPFLFDDAVKGVHQHHARPVLDTIEGQAKFQLSRNRIITKHGSEHPWNETPKTGWNREGFSATVLENSPHLLEAWTKWASSSPCPRLQAFFAGR
jgi:hypothetical protein